MSPDRIVFESSVVKMGEFRCPVEHPHFHATEGLDNYCFVFPRNACWIEHQGERPFVADSTTVPLYNPGRPFRRGAIDPAGDATDWFGVSPDLLREMVARFDRRVADTSDSLFSLGSVTATSEMFLTQRRVFNHVTHSHEPDALFVEETVISVLAEILSRTHDAGRREARLSSTKVAIAAKAHLGRTFLSKESVGEVASALGVSPFHLCRVFRRVTGYSLHGYRTELRLRWSLQPLAENTDILTVALAAGFSHHSHFTTAFRRTFGVTPSDFRSDISPRRLRSLK